MSCWFKLRCATVLSATFLLLVAITNANADPEQKPKLVIFDLELQDASHEGALNGVRADQTERLKLTSAELRKLIAESGRYSILSIDPIRNEIEKRAPIQYCNGCDGDFARQLGADLALVGFFYKVSNLILEIHLFIRDTKSDRIIKKMSGSIRSNNDKSWLHGFRWMVKHRMLADK